MTSASEAAHWIDLAGGLVVPAEPLRLVFNLQAQGFELSVDGHDLVVRPRSGLSPEDCQLLRRWKLHILAILNYEAPRCA